MTLTATEIAQDQDEAMAEHLRQTGAHILLVQDLLMAVSRALLARSLHHDESKLEPPEAEMFAKALALLKGSTYGSDGYRAALRSIKPALQHYYEHNRHHPEFWGRGIRDMNLVDLIEMVCDWYAAAKRHDDGDFGRSLEINRERFGIPDDLIAIIANTEDMMQEATA